MPLLADMQEKFSRAVLAGDESPAIAFAAGPVPAFVALRQHRNTVMGALVNALRIAFPTVTDLVGENFFDQAAGAFVLAEPLRTAKLADYGAGFPVFLENYAPAAQLFYLGDVARLDLAIDRVLQESQARRIIPLDDIVSLELPVHLFLLALNYPADLIRDGLGDDAALALIDLRAVPRWLTVWRAGRQVMVRAIRAPAARFLEEISQGAETAIAAATGDGLPDAALEAIQNDIFSASFCRVISDRNKRDLNQSASGS